MEKRKISAEIVADSLNPKGERITTFLLTYPRMIHAEVMTHRMFSRNAASSRAIPFETMLKSIEEDPFIPIAWQKDHKGMQGTEYIENETDLNLNINAWLLARNNAITVAEYLNHGVKEGRDNGVTKQLSNRLLEPFMWYTNLVTATEFDNFFELRCPLYETEFGTFRSWKDICDVERDVHPTKDMFEYNYHPDNLEKLKESQSGAEIHMQLLAEAMWDSRNESKPQQLKAGEWHIPFKENMDNIELVKNTKNIDVNNTFWKDYHEQNAIKIATARAARLSYMTFDGEIDYEKDIKLHDMLLERKHSSPFEHCARVMNEEEYHHYVKGELIDIENGDNDIIGIDLNMCAGWANNFKGFIPYRYMIEKDFKNSEEPDENYVNQD